MFSSQLPVATGTVVAIETNPLMPKRVAVGLIAGHLQAQLACTAIENSINQDLANYWAAVAGGDQGAVSAARAKYNEHVGEATDKGCWVRYVLI
jgi:hypothetical protein